VPTYRQIDESRRGLTVGGSYVDRSGKRWEATAGFEMQESRLECSSLMLFAMDGQPITKQALAEFPMHLIDELRPVWQRRVVGMPKPPEWSADQTGEFLQRFAGYPEQPRKGRGGRKPLPLEDLRAVADVYVRARRDEGRSDPVNAVAEELMLSKSTASKRVQRARQVGLIPPGEERRPGWVSDSAGGSDALTTQTSYPSSSKPAKRKGKR
jgi:hypothetical protein